MPDDKIIEQARKDFEASKTAWSDVRSQFKRDNRYVNILGGQWDPKVKSYREQELKQPALEFNALAVQITQVANRCRQERPQPKIAAGDTGDPQVAETFEGKLRHIQYASQADVAYDTAVEAAATGGFGCYRITREYVSDKSMHQEPRVRRILDSMNVYFDGEVVEPDFSDARFCFVPQRMARKEFKAKFGVEPVSFENENGTWFGDDSDNVWWSEYYQVNKFETELLELATGENVLDEDLDAWVDKNWPQLHALGYRDPEQLIMNRRPKTEQTVMLYTIDGEKVLEKEGWPGKWIPIIPVLGREVIVDGRRQLISTVRFSLDAQKMKNALGSGIVSKLGSANASTYTGPKGAFKDSKWSDGLPHPFKEWEVLDAAGNPIAGVTRDTAEVPIQSDVAMFLQMGEAIKTSVGYVDNVAQPSRSLLSGVAVDRREQQQDLTQYHIKDNLERSQQHAGRVMLDLLLNLTDTPRVWTIRKPDGKNDKVPVTMAGKDGTLGYVPGHRPEQHHRIDIGEYDVVIAAGKAYETKIAEETDSLEALLNANPIAWSLYGDLFWEKLGYEDLAERAKFGLNPAVQQSLQQQGKPNPALLQQQNAQMQQELMQLKQALQQLLMKLQTKQIEAQGRLQVEQLRTAGNIQVEKMKTLREGVQQVADHRHDAAVTTHQSEIEAIQHMMQIFHESELAPPPMAPGAQQAGSQ